MSRAGAVLLLLVGACGEEEPPVVAAPQAPRLPNLETRDVVGSRIAELEATLALPEPPPPAERDHVRGLTATVAARNLDLREIALEEVLALGDAGVPELATLVRDPTAADAERETALFLLGRLDSVRAAEFLLVSLQAAGEPWIRAHAAWRLGETTQDWVLPSLLLRLKYETDHETVVWLSKTLAAFGDFTGLGGLHVVATTSVDEAQRSSAWARMQEIAAAAGSEDAYALWRAWDEGRAAEMFQRERSLRYDLEVLRWIARFDDFQLRGVDDARFLLARLGPRGVELMGMALADDSLYVRVNTAQSLQRMGRRGSPAGEALLALLGDRDAGPNAAEALGSLAYAPAEAVLVGQLLPGGDPALRLACARALGGFGVEPGVADTTLEALRALVAETETPAEVRQAAVESLAWLGAGDEVAAVLLDFFTRRDVEPATTERALRAWLETKGAPDVLTAWDALTFSSTEIVSYEDRRAARVEQRRLVEEALDRLVPGP